VNTVLDRTLAALADPVRRRVVEELRQRPCRAGELAQILEISPPAMEDARIRVYHLCPAPFQDLGQWLRHVEGLWNTQLEAFAAFVEKETQ
jgi:hypothetical protein